MKEETSELVGIVKPTAPDCELAWSG